MTAILAIDSAYLPARRDRKHQKQPKMPGIWARPGVLKPPGSQAPAEDPSYPQPSVPPIGTPLHPSPAAYRSIGPSAPSKAMPTGRAYRSTEARRQRPQEPIGRAGQAGNARRWVQARQRDVVARGKPVSACSLA